MSQDGFWFVPHVEKALTSARHAHLLRHTCHLFIFWDTFHVACTPLPLHNSAHSGTTCLGHWSVVCGTHTIIHRGLRKMWHAGLDLFVATPQRHEHTQSMHKGFTLHAKLNKSVDLRHQRPDLNAPAMEIGRTTSLRCTEESCATDAPRLCSSSFVGSRPSWVLRHRQRFGFLLKEHQHQDEAQHTQRRRNNICNLRATATAAFISAICADDENNNRDEAKKTAPWT